MTSKGSFLQRTVENVSYEGVDLKAQRITEDDRTNAIVDDTEDVECCSSNVKPLGNIVKIVFLLLLFF